ncbi:MAG: DUF202 domain-containing protein [Deltaproteobacteria bacterium]|nr:DUF202 domain-containing protein [Deltaproteobacteria bacterium]
MIHTNSQSPFQGLVKHGILDAKTLAEALGVAERHGLPPAEILLREYDLPRAALQQALADHYHCGVLEYDERLPIPPELLSGLETEKLREEGWFPVIKKADGTVVVACTNPADPALPAEVQEILGTGPFEFKVCLPDDIRWFTEDFLHAKPGKLVGTERTGLAYWRNNMAQWRTALACYRTDMARARTALAIMRAGLGLITISFALTRAHYLALPEAATILILVLGCVLAVGAVLPYLEVRRSRLRPPGDTTLVEVTATEVSFLKNYLNPEKSPVKAPHREKMLARISDRLLEYCTLLYPPPGSLERTHLARERNVLAAQRTIAACNRTIYARARTGLAFIRTGISFISIGIGLIKYFGPGRNTIFDALLILIGLLLTIDGARWYRPAHRSQTVFSELGSRFRLENFVSRS